MTLLVCAAAFSIFICTAFAVLSSSHGNRTLDDVAFELEKLHKNHPRPDRQNIRQLRRMQYLLTHAKRFFALSQPINGHKENYVEQWNHTQGLYSVMIPFCLLSAALDNHRNNSRLHCNRSCKVCNKGRREANCNCARTNGWNRRLSP